MKQRIRFYDRYCVLTDWNIGIVRASPADLESLVTDGRLGPVRWCPRASLFSSRADPFIWPLERAHRVIYEEVDHWSGLGHISSLSLQEFSHPQRPRVEIKQSYHLSYPFVVQSDDVWYCIPESSRSGGIDLYVWYPPTSTWRFKRRLIDGIAILDASFLRHEGVWYLFGTVRGEGSFDRLRIWWSKSLEGDWQSHAHNPAKVDLRSARSAGPFFAVGGRWYRPAQDCTTGYGRAVTINSLDVLTPSEFAETTVSRIAPDPNGPYPDGLHTLAVYGEYVLIDGKRVGFSAALLLMKAVRRIVRLFRPGWPLR